MQGAKNAGEAFVVTIRPAYLGQTYVTMENPLSLGGRNQNIIYK